MIKDERAGLTWDVRPNSEVEGAVDITVEYDSGKSAEDWPEVNLLRGRYTLECLPLDVLEQLVAKAKVVVK